jgi:hypothetical protein
VSFGLLVSLLALAPSAWAGQAQTIIHRCNHGESLTGFSQQDYRKALRELPTITREYTDCSELIHRAQLAGAGRGARGGAAGGGSGSTAPSGAPVALALSPSEQRAVQSAHHVGATPVTVGKGIVTPGVVHANVASAVSSLPTPLLVILAFLVAAGVGIAGGNLRNHVRAKSSR